MVAAQVSVLGPQHLLVAVVVMALPAVAVVVVEVQVLGTMETTVEMPVELLMVMVQVL